MSNPCGQTRTGRIAPIKPRLAGVVIAVIVAMLTLAVPAFSAPVQHSPESDDRNQHQPRTTDELARIVVLCATEAGSPRFDSAWVGWVRGNPDADIDKTVDTVIGKARTMRSMALSSMEPKSARKMLTDVQVADHMRDLARGLAVDSNRPTIRILSPLER